MTDTTDPRLTTVALTANEILQDRAIRRAVFLEQFKAGEANRLISFLNLHVYPDLIAKIQSGLDETRNRGFSKFSKVRQQERYRRMLTGIDEVVGTGMSSFREQLNGSLNDFVLAEARWQVGVVKSSTPISIDLLLPSPATLRSVVVARPFQGRLLKDWAKSLDVDLRRRVRQQINIGIVEGEGTDAIVRRIRGTQAARFADGVLDISRRQAQAVVRTAVNHVSSHARQSIFEANTDTVKGVQWVSTLDSRTSVICSSLDGQVFPVESGPRPPAHINCRSTTTPVLRSWRELGIDLKEAPPGTRASMNGQVPADTTYGQWLKGQPVELQNEVLGRGKATLFRRGQVPIEKFTNKRLRPLTLAELEALELRMAS